MCVLVSKAFGCLTSKTRREILSYSKNLTVATTTLYHAHRRSILRGRIIYTGHHSVIPSARLPLNSNT